MSRRLVPQAATAGWLLKIPPGRNFPAGCGRRPSGAGPSLVEHVLVNAERKDVEAVLAPATTAGGLLNFPPRASQPVVEGAQALPVQALWNI